MSDWPARSTPRVAPGVRTLVLGGVRSGKSAFAESIARNAENIERVRYIATGRAGDVEMERRIAVHRVRRPAGWETVETGDIVPLLLQAEAHELLLIDSLGEWLSWRLLDDWDEEGSGEAAAEASARLDPLIAEVAEAVHLTRAALVIVGHEVGEGGVALSPMGRVFADANGLLSQLVAAACDMVYKVTAGIPQRLR